MRCYFNLLGDSDTILDTDGIEVEDIAQARAQALKAIEELRDDEDMLPDDWQGWRLEVVDDSGEILFSIGLGRTNIH
jgi:hypothetical protein